MYAVEATSTVSQGNAKSCIQALLKTREHHSVSSKLSPKSSKKESSSSSPFAAPAEYSDLGTSAQNLELISKSYIPTDNISYEAASPENLDYQKDFNYSQKLFHIADGNLYSIFSPIQGRSYGMKPSFLRKQKYTVQECHSRGRKNLRKGLKFHNFLPSESVTSEKDNGYLQTKWKIHSECRLREEHGTKQITISNWSQSVQNPENGMPEGNKEVVKGDSSSIVVKSDSSFKQNILLKYIEDDCKIKSSDEIDPYDFNLSLHSSPENSNMYPKISKESTLASDKMHNSSESSTTRKDSLSFVLNSLIDKSSFSGNQNVNCDETESINKSSCQYQKHRRKPTQTRRIVPYVKYLSIMEENESLPLDLSSKCTTENASGISEELENAVNSKNTCSMTKNDIVLNHQNVDAIPNSHSDLLISSLSNSTAVSGALQTPVSAPMALVCPFPVNKNVKPWLHLNKELQDTGILNSEIHQYKNNASIVPPENSLSLINRSLPNTSQFTVQKHFIKETQLKAKRRNQRSVIKQKLEDTFRQNGFLVKTKQVSDGEATFCKFRQLRKYTRYYLKSWQQHLPDEVHKMWKGFLPPKTVLPPVSGSSDNINGAVP